MKNVYILKIILNQLESKIILQTKIVAFCIINKDLYCTELNRVAQFCIVKK